MVLTDGHVGACGALMEQRVALQHVQGYSPLVNLCRWERRRVGRPA